MRRTALFLLFSTAPVFSLSANFPPSAAPCSAFSVSFSGSASPPFTLLLLPTSSSSPEIIPIPEVAWDSTTSQGIFNTTLSFPTGTEFISVLHDDRGRAAGTVSDLYVVGPSSGTAPEGCVRQPVASENIFTLTPSLPTQCDIQVLSWDRSRLNTLSGGQDPSGEFLNLLNFTSYIPRGQTFRLDPINTEGTTSQAIWLVNVAAGLRYISLLEYYNRDGVPIRETTSLEVVQTPSEGNADCLGPDSPTVTASGASPSVASVGSISRSPVSTMSPSPSPSGSALSSSGPFNKRNMMVLVGGCSAALILLAALGCFLCIRRQRRRNQDAELNNGALEVDLESSNSPSLTERKLGESRSNTPEVDSLPPLPTAEKLHKRNPARSPTRRPKQ
ncbi:hypothetical protein FRC17_007541, partial [Serendipita sp. 399]